MMLLNFLLVMFYAFNFPAYIECVKALNASGCRVYDTYYSSCPNTADSPRAIPIPPDAVEVILP
jgi:hypothetical protein